MQFHVLCLSELCNIQNAITAEGPIVFLFFFFRVAVLRDPVILGSTLITYSDVVGEQRLLMQQVREGESCSGEV